MVSSLPHYLVNHQPLSARNLHAECEKQIEVENRNGCDEGEVRVFDVKMTYLPQLEHEQSEPQLPIRRFMLAGHPSFIIQ